MFLAVHTASHKNQNCSGSSDPVPLKTGSLMSSFIWTITDLGGEGGGLVVGGGELTGVDLPATGILRIGLLSDCDRFLGVTDLRCGVIGGFLTEGVYLDSDFSILTGIYSIFWSRV